MIDKLVAGNSFRNIFFLLLIVIAGFTSCEEDPTTVGLDLIPPKDKVAVSFTDSFAILSSTITYDSIVSGNLFTTRLGDFSSDVFGVSKASFLTQFLVNNLNPEEGTAILDSVVLHMRVSNVYGDSMARQKIKVYEMTDTLDSDKAYYPFLDPSPYYNPSVIGQKTTTFSDSIISVKLTPEIGRTLLSADSSQLASTSAFQQYFNGLYVEAIGESTGSLGIIDLKSEETELVIYYNDTLSRKFPTTIRSGETSYIVAGNVNIINHNYDNAVFAGMIGDTPAIQENIYVQGAAGVRSEIKLERLEEFKGQYAVSKAELIVPLDSVKQGELQPLDGLILSKRGEGGVLMPLEDQLITGNFIGGGYDEDSKSYTFSIPLHIQSYLNGEIASPDIIISANINSSTLGHSILKGDGSSNGIQLRLFLNKL
jgi:hypothetical protein